MSDIEESANRMAHTMAGAARDFVKALGANALTSSEAVCVMASVLRVLCRRNDIPSEEALEYFTERFKEISKPADEPS